MDPFKQQGTSQRNSNQSQYNPFARALAEAEKRSAGQKKSPNNSAVDNSVANSEQNLFNAQHYLNQNKNLEQLKQQQEQELKKRQMREKLHKMVNPVEQSEIFSAKEAQRKKEIEEIRKELKKLAEEIAKFYQEVDITLTQNVASPGQEGTYHQNFFKKLKEFIIMLRQQVRSARTWARQMQAKQKKRGPRIGLNFKGNEAKATHDMLHHERSNAYSGT
jgi:vacuolar-type H+-ATPase subunit I/STV1